MPELFFLLFAFLKPFYMLPSGSVGLADLSMAVCAASLAFRSVKKKELVSTFRQDWMLYLFLIAVAVINGIYTIIYNNYEFVRYTAFWIYNAGAIWSFRQLGRLYGQSFFTKLNYVIKGNIGIQFLVFLSGRGRIFYEYWGGTRYMGTFNDPNQLAFFLFMMMLLAYLYACRYGDRSFPVFYLLALPVILASKSTGILLGVMIFTGLAMIWKGYEMGKSCIFPEKCGFVQGLPARF